MTDQPAPRRHVDDYEAKRREIHARYTPLLKAMSASDPGYERLWSERVGALRALADGSEP